MKREEELKMQLAGLLVKMDKAKKGLKALP
jgi:hypothetical protein